MTRRSLALGAAALVAARPALALEGPSASGYVTGIEVRKLDRVLRLVGSAGVLRTYAVRLGDPVGPKRFVGDRRTPEGRYRIAARNPQSSFHRSLLIDYPNRLDRSFAARRGQDPGGDIFIHGQPNGVGRVLRHDWTRGCIALSNAEMDELWRFVPVGCPIVILP